MQHVFFPFIIGFPKLIPATQHIFANDSRGSEEKNSHRERGSKAMTKRHREQLEVPIPYMGLSENVGYIPNEIAI